MRKGGDFSSPFSAINTHKWIPNKNTKINQQVI